MPALSVQDVERFTPGKYLVDGEVPADAPVYLIGAMSRRERARWRAELAGAGVRIVHEPEVIAAVRQAIAELAPANADELLAAVQAYDDMPSKPVLVKIDSETDEEAEARRTELALRKEVSQNYLAVSDMLRQHPAVGKLNSLRTLSAELVPFLTAAFCLRGWENVKVTFQRVNGIVPDTIMESLPEDDVAAIGNKALELLNVSEAQKGN